MSKSTEANQLANKLIKLGAIAKEVENRIQDVSKKLLKKDPCIDVHTHFFDRNSTSAGYMLIRFAKDFLQIRGQRGETEEAFIEEAYKKIHDNPPNWDRRLLELLNRNRQRGGIGGVAKILTMPNMAAVYDYYLKDSSLAQFYNKPDKEVLTSVLMMDFKKGWGNPRITKSYKEQITEVKKLSITRPVLPFLFCDPRRFEDSGTDENLYALFNYAFTGRQPFFGVKIYPALGYLPSDYRLDPIFKICNDLRIPVLSHCGGNSVSTPKRKITVYNGTKEAIVSGRRRKDVADILNDPAHWKPVLKKHKNLVLNLAHFGSDDTWSQIESVEDGSDKQHRKETIIELMNTYPNVYADFAYVLTNKTATRNLIHYLQTDTRIRDRTLFGSDFWVVNKAGQLKENQEKFLNTIRAADPFLVDLLCKTNPKKYLFGEVDVTKLKTEGD